jgi:hypothetical protein
MLALSTLCAELSNAGSALEEQLSEGIGLKFDDGQEGNQFSEIDCQFSILGWWRWRCLAGGFLGTLRLENLLSLAASREGRHLEVKCELATHSRRHSRRSPTS